MGDFGFLVYLAAALLGLVGWLWRRWKTRGHSHWPATEGTVESHRLEQVRHSHRWVVVYSYCADGEYFSGEFVPDLPWSMTRWKSIDALEDIVKLAYPIGAKFPVRFNPQEPEWSVPLSRQRIGTSPVFE